MRRFLTYAAAGLIALCLSQFMASPVRGESRADVITLINVAAERHAVDPDLLGRVLFCESRWNAAVTGPDGSMGIAQFQRVTWTWASRDAGWSGFTPYHAEAAIDVMAWLVSRGGLGHWGACV